MKTFQIIAALLLGSAMANVGAQSPSIYKIANKIHLPGDGKWDYLYSDDAASRLYVSHGTMVQVVDETNGKLIGSVAGLNGVHGIAIDAELNKGYITSGKDTAVTVFDTQTFAVLKRITVSGLNPDAVLFDPFSKKVFAFNGKSNNATVIDVATDAIVATIPFTGNPEFSVTDGSGKVYVNLESASSIAVINTSTLKVENVWPLTPGEEPTGLALDYQTHRLFSACANKLMLVVNAENGNVITSLPIGDRVDGAAFDPELKRAYSSNGEGSVTVIQEERNNSFKVLETIQTQKGAKTITVNKKTHHVYTAVANFEDSTSAKPKIATGTFAVLDIVAQ